MKVLLSLAFLVLSSTMAIAQNAPPAKCPTVLVTGPPGLSNLGELATYTTSGVDQISYPIEYVWSVNGGQIRDGQGTNAVRVLRQADRLVVTVEIKGLPRDCPSSASVGATY